MSSLLGRDNLATTSTGKFANLFRQTGAPNVHISARRLERRPRFPKRPTGSYGTNGSYLDFSDNSAATAAAIGKDSSGNGNNFTPSGISVTAGVTNDSLSTRQRTDGIDTGRAAKCAATMRHSIPLGTSAAIDLSRLT